VVLVVWRGATTLSALTGENETAVLRLHEVVLVRLEAIPGVGRRTAEILVAEIGVDVRRFPSARHLASWAGLCPGQHESAGKHKRGKRRRGNMALHRALTEAAKATARTKKHEQTYFHGRDRRLVARCGKKKAATPPLATPSCASSTTCSRLWSPTVTPCSWLATSAGARTSSIARLRNFELWATR
jgi:hypothetical protein